MTWYEYDHASDEQTKALRRAHRDALIRVALTVSRSADHRFSADVSR
jgi:hypothetical protein